MKQTIAELNFATTMGRNSTPCGKKPAKHNALIRALQCQLYTAKGDDAKAIRATIRALNFNRV